MEMYARELSIKYACAEDNDTIKRLKEAGDVFVSKNKSLEAKVVELENQLKKYSSNINIDNFEEIKSTIFY